LATLSLEPVDLGAVLERLADIVQPVQQGMLPEGIEFKANLLAAGTDNNLAGKVDGDRALPPSFESSINWSHTARGSRSAGCRS